MFSFKKYQKIQKEIEVLSKKTEIIAISKNHPLEEVEKAISFGLEIFGENRVQEAKSKFEEVKKTNKKIKLHLTGPLTSIPSGISTPVCEVIDLYTSGLLYRSKLKRVSL